MTHTNTLIRDKETPAGEAAEVDEYTAKMDRMVNGLKKRSQTVHHDQTKSMIIWICVGVAITIAAIYLMLNVEFSGEPVKFLTR